MSASLLDRARAGDQAAFADLTARHVRELHLHCYRMLGSLTDADDALQETLFAAWSALPGFAGRSSLRAWLYRIATNRCLNAIRDGRRRPPAVPVPPFEPPPPSRRGDVTWLQPYPDAVADREPGPAERYETRERLELAFVTALQRLPPRQTAVLVLCEVLDFPLAEAAGMLDATPAAAKGLLQRARASLDYEVGSPPPARPASAVERELAGRFAAALSADDVEGVLALLTDDAWLAMPPAPHEYVGAAAIASFLRASAEGRAGRRLSLVPTRANGEPAFLCFVEAGAGEAVQPSGVVVLRLRGDRIGGITRFLDPVLVSRFDLARRGRH
ncbi:MAG TPA: RNA polymerase subunit sigma-70 [Candidatus Dormibacteraeota bacterium]|nr:RNA polymerase subunit sigma-70 [Candidatus Dormibacteraeota bacterium]